MRMEKENRIQFWLPNSDTKSPQKAAHDKLRIAPVKAFPVDSVDTKEMIPDLVLPLDVLVHIVLNLRHAELEPLSGISTTVGEAVAKARKMHFDYNTPVGRSSKRGNVCPGAPNPKHVWNPDKSTLTSDDVPELKAPIMWLAKMRCRRGALKSQEISTTDD